MVLPLLAAFLMAGSCASRVNISGDPSSDYHRLLSKQTRETSFFGLEEVRYLTSVTYKSRALREAYVAEYAKQYELNAEERETMLKKEMEEVEKYDTFVISHFATNRDKAKLDRVAKAWRLLLRTQEEKDPKSPDAVHALSGRDVVLRYFHPAITPWSKVFVAKFLKQEEPKEKLELRMVGIVDQLSFSWPLVEEN